MIAILAALVIGTSAVAPVSNVMTVKLWPDNNVVIYAPESFFETFTIDTGDAVISSVSVSYARDAVDHFQAVYWRRVYGCAVDNRCFSYPTILLPHFRIGNCDLGMVQLAATPDTVPNLLGAEQLRRIEPWSIDSKKKVFTFTCPKH